MRGLGATGGSVAPTSSGTHDVEANTKAPRLAIDPRPRRSSASPLRLRRESSSAISSPTTRPATVKTSSSSPRDGFSMAEVLPPRDRQLPDPGGGPRRPTGPRRAPGCPLSNDELSAGKVSQQNQSAHCPMANAGPNTNVSHYFLSSARGDGSPRRAKGTRCSAGGAQRARTAVNAIKAGDTALIAGRSKSSDRQSPNSRE